MFDDQRNTKGKSGLKEIDLLIQRYLADDLQLEAKEWYASNQDAALGLKAWFGTPDAVECKN